MVHSARGLSRCQNAQIIAVLALITFSVLLLAAPVSAFQYQNAALLSIRNAHATSLSVVRDPRTEDRSEKQQRHTEVARLRFQLQHVRDDLQLSEMRATAAERRVARLQAEIKEIQKAGLGAGADETGVNESAAVEGKQASYVQSEKDLERRLKKRFDKQKEALTERVRHFADALQQLKFQSQYALDDMKAAAMAEKTKLQKHIQNLQSELDGAHAELKAARDESAQLRRDMAEIQAKAGEEIEIVRDELTAALTETKRIAAQEMSALETSNAELYQVRREMVDQLIRAKEEAARNVEYVTAKIRRELIDAETKARLEQERLKKEGEEVLGARDDIIRKYEGERKSIRKLVGLTFRLAGERAVGVFRRRRK